MFSVKPNTARRALQTCVVVLLAALATVSVAAFAQQGSNKSANSQQHAPGADYSHRTRSPVIIPDIPGFQEGGRPNYGGCDAADVTMGRNGCGEPPRPPVCNDPNASNRGAPLPCQCNAGFVWNGSACQNTICRDDKAPNYGKPLPCEPPCPAGQVVLAGQCVKDPNPGTCLIPGNPGYGGPLPCPLCDTWWENGKCVKRGGYCETHSDRSKGGYYCGADRNPEFMRRNPPRTACYIGPDEELDHCGLPVPNQYSNCTPMKGGYRCPRNTGGHINIRCP